MSWPKRAADEGAATPVSRLGRYRIEREIGRGSMGRVFLGVDPRIDRKVALKVLDPGSTQRLPNPDELRRRFVAEARAAGRLNHPNIVTVYDAGLDPVTRLPYLAMEWVEGASLQEHLSRGPVSAHEAIEITRQIGEALDHAHRRGLVHRDVKPANILITDDGVAKLTDFGVAKLGEGDLQTTGGQVFGTPAYMSPEQIQGNTVDGRSDIFSLGACLYELVTGEAPFRGERLADVAYRIVHTDAPAPAELEIPALAPVLHRALAKSPEDRFPSARAMLDALAAAAQPDPEHESSAQRPSTPGGRTATPPTSRNRRLFLGVLAAGIVLPLAYFLIGTGVRRPSSPATPTAIATEEEGASPGEDATSPLTSGVASPAAVPEEDPVPEGAAEATLLITHVNRLRQTTLTLYVDNVQVWSEELEGPKNPLRRPLGTEISSRIPISSGRHDITVRLRGSKGKLDEEADTQATFVAGEERRLRVVLSLPPGRTLRLRWD